MQDGLEVGLEVMGNGCSFKRLEAPRTTSTINQGCSYYHFQLDPGCLES